jgi:hypothetical protein
MEDKNKPDEMSMHAHAQTAPSTTATRTGPQAETTPKGFCKRRMVTSEDPFYHTYCGSSEFDIAAFSTTFNRKSFERRKQK